MRRFVLRVLAFVAIQAAILAGILLHHRFPTGTFLEGSLVKHERLKAAPNARLVLVGGSALAFGIDSQALDRGLDRDVVNMALHAGLGIEFMLGEIEDQLRNGDVVVLSFEAETYSDAPSAQILFEVARLNPPARRGLGPTHLPVFLDHGHDIVKSIVKREVRHLLKRRDVPPSAPYSANSFNAYGDVTGHWTLPRRGFARSRDALSGGNGFTFSRRIESIRKFALNCQGRGIRIFYSFPPLPESAFPGFREEMRRIREGLETRVPIVHLDQPSDNVYPDEMFFDSVYHLTRDGVTRRTRELRVNLRGALKRED